MKPFPFTGFFLILPTLLVLSLAVTAQRKLILYNPSQTHVFKIGDELGITQKGQTNIFGNWKTICKPCDTIVQKNLWTIDSIAQNSFVLSRIIDYRVDTLTYEEYETLVKEYKKQKKRFPLIENSFFKEASNGMEKQEMYVIKFPEIMRQTVLYDSLESITVSRLKSEEYCSKGYILFPAAIGLMGVYVFFTEGVKTHPDKRTMWIGFGSAISGAILTKISIEMRNHNVETIYLEHCKIKIK